jgi:uncharacterized membrane protein
VPPTSRILLVGESWFIQSIHQKGFDTFQTATYEEGATHFVEGLRANGHDLRYVPSHLVGTEFPTRVEHLAPFDVVVLSDVGANTFLLTPETFGRSRIAPNRLEALREYVRLGGALLMIGGYMSFAGIDGKARFASSPLADVLPVVMKETDDRVEVPEGFVPEVVAPDHPALAGVPSSWPALLGYNQVAAAPGAETLVVRGDDPILTLGVYGDGRAAAFASDLAPHWAPPEFVGWEGYFPLWEAVLGWLAETPLSASRAGGAEELGRI